MKAAIGIQTENGHLYCLTEDSAAILADNNAIFVEDVELLQIELEVLHPTPEGFTNQGGNNYDNLYLTEDGKITNDYDLADKTNTEISPRDRQIVGDHVFVSDGLKATTADIATIQKVAIETGREIKINREITDQLLPEEQGAFGVFPVGEFLVWYHGTIEHNPKKAKSLKTKRANAAGKRVTTGEPKVDLVKGFRNFLCTEILKHKVMEVLTFKAGNTNQLGTSRGEIYGEIMDLTKAAELLFGEDCFKESDGFKAKIDELVPYIKGLSSMKIKEVPTPVWKEGIQRQTDWNAKNKVSINKAESHNRNIEICKKFAKWLRLYNKLFNG